MDEIEATVRSAYRALERELSQDTVPERRRRALTYLAAALYSLRRAEMHGYSDEVGARTDDADLVWTELRATASRMREAPLLHDDYVDLPASYLAGLYYNVAVSRLRYADEFLGVGGETPSSAIRRLRERHDAIKHARGAHPRMTVLEVATALAEIVAWLERHPA